MKTTILEHEIEYSWEGGGDHGLQESDIDHIRKYIEEGNNQGQLCQTDKENGEVENIGWWEIKSYEDEALKEMQKAEKLEYALDEIDGLLDQIDTMAMNTRNDKELSIGRELIEQNMEGIDNIIIVIKDKIYEAKK